VTQRRKVTLRLNPEVLDLVRQLAQDLGTSPAGVIDRLLLEGLQRYADDRLQFADCLEPAAQGRYTWTIHVDPNGLHDAIGRKVNIT
jgi:hypothetical protein